MNSRSCSRPFRSVRRRSRPVPRLRAFSSPLSSGTTESFLPLGYEPGYDYPLLVWLTRPNDPQFDLGRTMQRLSLRNYLAVRPCCSADSDQFDATDPWDSIWQAIEGMCDRTSVHPRRIFLIGVGDGGTEAFRLACRHPRRFAGVASLGGPFPLDEALFGLLSDIRRLPMLLASAADDSRQTADDTDRLLRLFHAAGAALSLRIYPQSSRSTSMASRAMLADVDRWIMDEVFDHWQPRLYAPST